MDGQKQGTPDKINPVFWYYFNGCPASIAPAGAGSGTHQDN